MLSLEMLLCLGNDNTGILMAGTTKCTMLRYRPGGMVNYLKKGTAMPAEVGEVAPDFTLPSVSEGDISLSQYRGQKHVVLSFHVFDFTSG
jgi:AhpC/TSA family protein